LGQRVALVLGAVGSRKTIKVFGRNLKVYRLPIEHYVLLDPCNQPDLLVKGLIVVVAVLI